MDPSTITATRPPSSKASLASAAPSKHDDPSSEKLPQVDGLYSITTPPPSGPRLSQDLVDWNGPQDSENPFNWTRRKKWIVTLLACFMTFVVQINGTAMTSAWEVINERFGVSDEVFPHSYWPVFSWTLGGAVAPMLALPLMEGFGVRWSYVGVYLLLIIFLIPQALAKNFATLIVTRIFTGGCSAILANITSGYVSDMWRDGKSKSFSTSLWIWCLLAGLNTGPITGSATLKFLSWRWIFWTEAIFYAVLIPIILFGLPEVRQDVILIARAKKIRSTTGNAVYAAAENTHISISDILQETVLRPARMLVTEPVVFSFGLWSAFCIGTAYMFTQSIVQVYSELYEWSFFETGMIQSAVVIGELLGLVATIFGDDLYFRSARRNERDPGVPIPEARLYISIPGSFIGLTGGLFFYAWTSYPHLHWMLPTIGLAFVGFGMMTVVTAITGYILDSYAKFAASAIACCAFLENIMAAFLPLCTMTMYSNLGFNWASSLLGFLALGLSLIPIVMMVYGPKIRERSPFMLQAGYRGKELGVGSEESVRDV